MILFTENNLKIYDKRLYDYCSIFSQIIKISTILDKSEYFMNWALNPVSDSIIYFVHTSAGIAKLKANLSDWRNYTNICYPTTQEFIDLRSNMIVAASEKMTKGRQLFQNNQNSIIDLTFKCTTMEDPYFNIFLDSAESMQALYEDYLIHTDDAYLNEEELMDKQCLKEYALQEQHRLARAYATHLFDDLPF